MITLPNALAGAFNPIVYKDDAFTGSEATATLTAGTRTFVIKKQPIDGKLMFDFSRLIRKSFVDKGVVDYTPGLPTLSNLYMACSLQINAGAAYPFVAYYGRLQYGETQIENGYAIKNARPEIIAAEIIAGLPFTVTFVMDGIAGSSEEAYGVEAYYSKNNGAIQGDRLIHFDIVPEKYRGYNVAIQTDGDYDESFDEVKLWSHHGPSVAYLFSLNRCRDVVYLRWINSYGAYRYVGLKAREVSVERKDIDSIDNEPESMTPTGGMYDVREITYESTRRQLITAGRDDLSFEWWSELSEIVLSDEVHLYTGGAWQKVNVKTTSAKADPRKDAHTFECQIDYPLF
jgi:hypothetical protein